MYLNKPKQIVIWDGGSIYLRYFVAETCKGSLL
jgi:hypothetical protein